MEALLPKKEEAFQQAVSQFGNIFTFTFLPRTLVWHTYSCGAPQNGLGTMQQCPSETESDRSSDTVRIGYKSIRYRHILVKPYKTK